jgi:predicted lipoprotein with Yx(FWY)xxD motif
VAACRSGGGGPGRSDQVRKSWVLSVAVGLALAGCGGSAASHKPIVRVIPGSGSPSPSQPSSGYALTSVNIKPFGQILVNGDDQSLYVFSRDVRHRVSCTGACQQMWPPVRVSAGKPSVGGQVRAALVGSVRNPAGGRALTYAGWPLYTYNQLSSLGYVPETSWNTAAQGYKSFGGQWHLISPAGRVITETGQPPNGVSYPAGA